MGRLGSLAGVPALVLLCGSAHCVLGGLATLHPWSLLLGSPHHTLLCTVQFGSVTQSCLTLCSSMDCSMPCSPVLHYLPEFPQTHSIESVMPSNHLILCYSFLLMPLLFLCIRVFSNESVLCIRWPKYWSFSFSISPSNEDSGLISFGID